MNRRRRRTGGTPILRNFWVRGLLWSAAVILVAFTLGYVLTSAVLFPATAGDRIATVPDLRGQSEDEARELLNRYDMEVEVGPPLDHPSAAAGVVLAQSPLPGREVGPGAAVRITVSAGASRRTVPDVTGLSAREAQGVLEEIGFAVRVDDVEHESDVGQVLEVRPEPGSMVDVPATLRMIVSRGPPRVDIPELVGQDEGDARRALEDGGLRMGEVEYNRFSIQSSGTVTAQRPAPGVRLRAGSSVDVTVAGRPPGDGNDSLDEERR